MRDSESAPRRERQRQFRPRVRRLPEEVPVALGGHGVVRAGEHLARPWQCRICHRSTARRRVLTCSRCPGSAVHRWARQNRVLAGSGRGMGGGHTILLTGSVVWCFRCGASACVQARLLTQPCRGRLLGLAQAHQRLLLGLHPCSRVPLGQATVPEPGMQLPRGYAAAVRRAGSSATAAVTPSRMRAGREVSVREEQPAWRTAMLATMRARSAMAATAPA